MGSQQTRLFREKTILNTVTLLGDSLTDQGTVSSAGSGVTPAAYNNSDRGYFTYANILLGHRMTMLANRGVSGENSAQILARVGSVIADAPGWCFVLSGTNDVLTATLITDADTIIANLLATYTALLNAGIKVGAITLIPNNSVSANQLRMRVIMKVNEWIRGCCATTKNMVLIDAFAVLADHTASTLPTGKSYIFQTDPADLTHLCKQGTYLAGKAVFNAMDKLLPKVVTLPISNADVWHTTNNSTGKQILQNPAMTGVGGTVGGTGISGTIPDTYNTANYGASTVTTMVCTPGVAATTVDANDDVSAPWTKFVISGTDAFYFAFFGSPVSNSWTTGDVVYGECEFRIESPVNIYHANLRVRRQRLSGATTVNDYSDDPGVNDVSSAIYAQTFQGILKTPAMPIIATDGAPNNLYLFLEMRGLASASATVYVRRMRLVKA